MCTLLHWFLRRLWVAVLVTVITDGPVSARDVLRVVAHDVLRVVQQARLAGEVIAHAVETVPVLAAVKLVLVPTVVEDRAVLVVAAVHVAGGRARRAGREGGGFGGAAAGRAASWCVRAVCRVVAGSVAAVDLVVVVAPLVDRVVQVVQLAL